MTGIKVEEPIKMLYHELLRLQLEISALRGESSKESFGRIREFAERTAPILGINPEQTAEFLLQQINEISEA